MMQALTKLPGPTRSRPHVGHVFATEKFGLGRNGEILLDRRPGHGSLELSEDYIEAVWHLSIGNSKSNPLVCGQTLSSDGRVETIWA